MPCYETRQTSVDLSIATDIEALAEALRAEGHSVGDVQQGTQFIRGTTKGGNYFSFAGGCLTVSPSDPLARDVNPLKRAYSKELIKMEARRKGWQARFKGETFELVKRRLG